jgi:ribonuclease HI
MKIYCDSSTKKACFVIDTEPRYTYIETYEKPVTNNMGEYLALNLVLSKAVPYLLDNYRSIFIDIFSDSQLMVNQVNGLFACREPNLKWILNYAQGYLEGFRTGRGLNITLQWIPREQNLAGLVLDGKDI